MRTQTQIYSIFGQIESVVAQAMIDEGVCSKIDPWMIPPTAAFNPNGERALFAIVIPAAALDSFERRIAVLQA